MKTFSPIIRLRSVESSGQPTSHAHRRGGGVSRGGGAQSAEQTGERVLRQLRDEKGVCLKMHKLNDLSLNRK